MSGTPLNGFKKLNDITALYTPDQSDTGTTSSEPSLIVYCSWMGAAKKHIAKYTDGMKRLFPQASILLIESTLPNMFMGSDLAPALEVINSFTRSYNDHDPYIVLQACSNGGAQNATWLADRLLETNTHLPFRKVILDCCPGKGEPKAATEAVTLSLPKQPLIRAIGSWLFYSTFMLMMWCYMALGWDDQVTRIRKRLNDASVFSTEVPRLYLYSQNDALVKWEHVHEHAEDGRRKGYVVREERFQKAAHVALLMEDGDRYWGAVREHVLGRSGK